MTNKGRVIPSTTTRTWPHHAGPATSSNGTVYCIPPEYNLPPLPTLSTNHEKDKLTLPFSYEVIACRALGIAYIHIFKSGGSAIMESMVKYCLETTNQKPMYFGFTADTLVASLNTICNHESWLCFTFYRDPVERFLSGYHEVNRAAMINKQVRGALEPDFDIQGDIPLEQKLEHVNYTISKMRDKGMFNAHYQTQAMFLKTTQPNHRRAAFKEVAFFDLNHALPRLEKLYCSSYLYCMNNLTTTTSTTVAASTKGDVVGLSVEDDDGLLTTPRIGWQCPAVELPRKRSRRAEGWAMPRYLVEESDLTEDIIDGIAELYNEDYCWFGIDKHPRASRDVHCR